MKYITAMLILALLSLPLAAEQKEQRRVQNAGVVMKEILNVPDGIPRQLLDKAECVIVLPSVIKLAFGFGGSYGRGVMTCRSGGEFTGSWGAPAMIALEGGSFGLQIGGQATDYVLLVMNPRGADSILSSKVKLGAGISASAGPKGRDAIAATDAALRAEVLSLLEIARALRGRLPRWVDASAGQRSKPEALRARPDGERNRFGGQDPPGACRSGVAHGPR